MRHWFKNFMRVKQMINPQFAAYAKNRLALLYLFGAWNIFGLVVAVLYKENVPKVHDSVDYAKVLGLKDATVVKMSNLTVVDQYDIQVSDKELADFKGVIGTKEELEKYEQENEERIRALARERKNQMITNS